jgi:two-component system OmpR family response regulator
MPDNANLANKKMILIVDDDQFMRVIFEDALTSAGFLVTTAADGESALGKFKHSLPDLVLLDLVMPKKYATSLKANTRRYSWPPARMTQR